MHSTFVPKLVTPFGSGGKVTVKYDGQTEEEEVPGFLGGGFVVNLGFGVAF